MVESNGLKVERRIIDLTSLSHNFPDVDSNVFEFAVSVTELDVMSESEASDVTSEREASLTSSVDYHLDFRHKVFSQVISKRRGV